MNFFYTLWVEGPWGASKQNCIFNSIYSPLPWLRLILFFGHFRPILGSEKLVFSSYLQLHPTKMQNYFKKPYITTKYHPWPSLRKKIIALNITLVLFLHHALQYVFRTCKIDIFTLFLDPKMSTCQGSQKIFLSAVIRANIGLSISGEKNLGNCILL